MATERKGVLEVTYQDKIRVLQRELDCVNEQMSKLLEGSIDAILEEVIVNVGFDDYQTTIAIGMIEQYFDLLGIQMNGIWVWDRLKRRALAYESREETGWGEHDYFARLSKRGLSIRHTEGGDNNGTQKSPKSVLG